MTVRECVWLIGITQTPTTSDPSTWARHYVNNNTRRVRREPTKGLCAGRLHLDERMMTTILYSFVNHIRSIVERTRTQLVPLVKVPIGKSPILLALLIFLCCLTGSFFFLFTSVIHLVGAKTNGKYTKFGAISKEDALW